MRSLHLLLAVIAPLLIGAARPYAVTLSTGRCRALPPATSAEFGPFWIGLDEFAERCVVPRPDGRPALTVDVVRLDRAYAVDFFAAHPNQRVPQPIIRDMKGVPVGFLSDQFPVDPPSCAKVTFARWRNGWPQEIRLYEACESALAPHAEPPMRWHPRDRVFQDTD